MWEYRDDLSLAPRTTTRSLFLILVTFPLPKKSTSNEARRTTSSINAIHANPDSTHTTLIKKFVEHAA
jgi:hypothetical protein